MSISAIIFMVIFWALILGMCGITLSSLLKHEANKK